MTSERKKRAILMDLTEDDILQLIEGVTILLDVAHENQGDEDICKWHNLLQKLKDPKIRIHLIPLIASSISF